MRILPVRRADRRSTKERPIGKISAKHIIGINPVARRHHDTAHIEHKNRQPVDVCVELFKITIRQPLLPGACIGRQAQEGNHLRAQADRTGNMRMPRYFAINCRRKQIKLMARILAQMTQTRAL